MVKTEKQKVFKLVADKSKPDPLVMKYVVFDVDDEDYGSNISHNFGGIHKIESSTKRKGKKEYTMSTVIHLEKKRSQTK